MMWYISLNTLFSKFTQENTVINDIEYFHVVLSLLINVELFCPRGVLSERGFVLEQGSILSKISGNPEDYQDDESGNP